MKQRKLSHVIILGIITLGIYDVYWLVSTRKEMTARGFRVPSLWRTMLYPLLGVVAAIAVGIVSSTGDSNKFFALYILFLVFSLIAWVVLSIRFISGYCKAAEQITNHDLTYSYSFWMGMLLYVCRVGFIWEAIVQYHYNRIGTVPANQMPAAQPQGPPNQPQVSQPAAAAAVATFSPQVTVPSNQQSPAAALQPNGPPQPAAAHSETTVSDPSLPPPTV